MGCVEPVAIDCGKKTIHSWVHMGQVVVPTNLSERAKEERKERE